MKKSAPVAVSRFTQINLARQAGIDDAEAGKVKSNSTNPVLVPESFVMDDSLRCAYIHGVRLVWRKDRFLRMGRTPLANAIRMPDLYPAGEVLPLH